MADHKLTLEAWERLQKEIPAIEPKTGLEPWIEGAEEEDLLEFSQAEEDEKDDAINPDHYKSGLIECIEAIEESMTTAAFAGYLKGNVQKYLWRYETKHADDPLQDLQKAEWYLSYLIGVVGEDYE
tara:strand:+ start:182 stop:559 length:378 start_codon:yes stop_codon:yes gene_type:complete